QEIKEAIEALVIDFDSQDLSQDDQDTSESFLTTFGPVTDAQALLTTADLANRSFAHAVSPVKPLCGPAKPPPEQDPFVYSNNTTSRYTSNKFYGIMINTGASKRSTAG